MECCITELGNVALELTSIQRHAAISLGKCHRGSSFIQ